MNNRLINTKVAGGGGGCTDIVDNYDPFGGNGVALYQLNGDATDVSGNYNGTATNVTYGAGQFGQAGVFNGSSSNINVNSFPVLTEFSLSFWMKTIDTSNTIILQFYDGSNVNANSIQTGLSGGNYYLSILPYNTSAGQGRLAIDFAYTSQLYNGNWNQLTYTTTGSVEKWYINGAEVPTFKENGYTTTARTTANLKIGVRGDGYGYFNGSIDQVRIFNTALTPLEVEALYTEELCICDGTVDTLDILGDGSCIATYQLDGNANDLSGNYSGTPTDVSYGVGEFDLAGVFNGSSSVIEIPANIIPNNYVTSISVWVKGASLANSGSTDIIFQNANGGPFFALITQSNVLEIFTRNSSATNYRPFQYSLSNFNTTDWYHICVTFSGLSNAVNLYVNGVNVDSGSLQSSSLTYTLSNTIGNESGNTIGWNGSIDQVRIFNKALSAGEVTTLYNETACDVLACSGTTNTLDILGDGSCIAAYPLDGSPADLSGNYNGVQTDVTYPVGKYDLGGSFNGSSSQINIAATATTPLDFSNRNYTLSAWVKTTASSGVIISKYGDDDSLRSFTFGIVNNTPRIYERINGGGTTTTANTSVNDGSWHHVLVTKSPTQTIIYIDGVSDVTNNNTTISNDGGIMPIYIGRDNPSSPDWFNGSIDQVRIFNKALSAGEVTTLYNETPCN